MFERVLSRSDRSSQLSVDARRRVGSTCCKQETKWFMILLIGFGSVKEQIFLQSQNYHERWKNWRSLRDVNFLASEHC